MYFLILTIILVTVFLFGWSVAYFRIKRALRKEGIEMSFCIFEYKKKDFGIDESVILQRLETEKYDISLGEAVTKLDLDADDILKSVHED